MGEYGRNAFVIPWTETWIEGLRGAPVSALELGASWQWRGGAAPVVLTGYNSTSMLAAVRRALGTGLAQGAYGGGDDPCPGERWFTVSDGRRLYRLEMIDLPETARPVLLARDSLPPAGMRLRIVATSARRPSINRTTDQPTGVICFTRGTLVTTPSGPRPVEDLVEGDLVSTKDDGPAEVLWTGARRMSGARLHAMPELRPVRLRAGAVDGRIPSPDLVVSPQHRILIKGPSARALFGDPEVLVAARDLIDDRGILVERGLSEVTYVHILLPRHQIVWANGVETESFHPASTNLETITEDQRAQLLATLPGIEVDPAAYGASARKALTADEAAIFGADRRPRH